MKRLNEEQLNFLVAETKKPKDSFKHMSREENNRVRDFCFDIECDEADRPGKSSITPRGEMAADIVDALYYGHDYEGSIAKLN